MWYNFILLLESKDVSKDTLDAWERTWSSSARSQLVDRKREKGATNGYLEQQGSNGRHLNVLLQSSLHDGPGAVPIRVPNYVEHLNSDQRDVYRDILQNLRSTKAP
ncbi:hypothetical protein DPMN_068100 [Dreissena polymorpha]|uniref:Uncharacterized protein n=1 Tax=Dreissena polymorpha TaxID=45954 RepID=A0A9D3YWZ3_DREPO|nr:hypothetical protein DPMN_068100 [Dreissena polymorpha]